MARILGVSCYFHDAAAALVDDGVLVRAAEEERFSRVKHDASFPELAIRFCLEEGPVEHVAFYEDPRVKLRRVVATAAAMGKPAEDAFVGSMRAWLGERRHIRSRLAAIAGVPKERVVFVDHHISHAASAFFPSPFESAAVMTIDGVGEWATAAIGHGESAGGRHVLELDAAVDFPHSIGLFYSALTAFLGFEVNEGEYKVMGMAPYGEPRFAEELGRVLQTYEDGSFWLDMSYFTFHYSSRRAFSEKLPKLLGIEPRKREEEFAPDEARSRHYADIAASVQHVAERAIVNLARAAQRRTASRRLCFAGGVALNVMANRRILDETDFEELFIPPAPGDSGGALGAALYLEHVVLGNPKRSELTHAYWGAEYGVEQAEAAVAGQPGLAFRRAADEDDVLAATIEALERGDVVGWYQGRFELGPRALGNRSIIADPRSAEMKERINEKIKFREPFRPFAPVAAEEAADSLVREPIARLHPARFMLLITHLTSEASAELPAVSHFGTARLQTVREEWNPRFYRLLRRWGDIAGTPVLLNTSFNLRGEPIVTTPEDALSTFERSGLDLLVLGDVLVTKTGVDSPA